MTVARSLVFDIEGDELLPRVTTIWEIRAKDIKTHERFVWYPFLGDDSWQEMFRNARMLIGHNICSYDIPAMEKVTGWKPSAHTKIVDTFLLSLILDFNKFPHCAHGLENWGNYLQFQADPEFIRETAEFIAQGDKELEEQLIYFASEEGKLDYHDFSQYTPEMDIYCAVDVELNHAVYEDLMSFLKAQPDSTKEKLKTYIKVEHAVAKWQGQAQLKGWPFNTEKAVTLRDTLAAEVEMIKDKLEPLMGYRCIYEKLKKADIDKLTEEDDFVQSGEPKVREVKRTKAGDRYDATFAKYYGVDPWSGHPMEDNPIDGPHVRVEFKKLKLSSIADVKYFLFKQGWEPLEWNMKRDPETNEWYTTSPKITEDDLELLGGEGKLYADYAVAKSRLSILENWIKGVDAEGRLHGECFVVGTPSMRMRHSIICNIPSTDAKYGPEMRELFEVPEGWVQIGADSSGNQARGLAHYLQSPEYTDLLLNGDIHTYNAEAGTKICKEMGEGHIHVERGPAKRMLYAFLFGASGGKLWSYISGSVNATLGNKFKNKFMEYTPGLKALMDMLKKVYGSTRKRGEPYIVGIAGNRVYVDSPHKLLVYLLQACEKATCGAALMLLTEWLEAEGIPFQPLIMYHDEVQFMVPVEYAERAAELAKLAFKEGPKLFGIEIMDGESKIGHNWRDCH